MAISAAGLRATFSAALRAAEAVLGRDRAAERIGSLVHLPGDLRPPALEVGLAHALGRQHVVVQVAIADMAEGHDPEAGKGRLQRRRAACQEVRQGRDRQGDVVCQAGPRLLARPDDGLPPFPEVGALSFVLGDDGVGDRTGLEGLGQAGLQLAFQMSAVGARKLED